ncbi:hypothetical protein BC938DRAFT_476778 [Jimgerdemannia flammicorona]|uniref:Secreted protein n=1 Tax=Jimgerdemannia flammicorona TaxID=994334 RepID=A0A433QQ68_9FUNG|nr:hypothetical protein BC938DRAFT_476778 [Jimgerdemannia flammicorona]
MQPSFSCNLFFGVLGACLLRQGDAIIIQPCSCANIKVFYVCNEKTGQAGKFACNNYLCHPHLHCFFGPLRKPEDSLADCARRPHLLLYEYTISFENSLNPIQTFGTYFQTSRTSLNLYDDYPRKTTALRYVVTRHIRAAPHLEYTIRQP